MSRREPDRNRRENPSASNRYAAAILRGLDERIDRLENAVSTEGTPNVLRAAQEDVVISEDVQITTTVNDTPLQWDDQSATVTTWDDTATGATWG